MNVMSAELEAMVNDISVYQRSLSYEEKRLFLKTIYDLLHQGSISFRFLKVSSGFEPSTITLTRTVESLSDHAELLAQPDWNATESEKPREFDYIRGIVPGLDAIRTIRVDCILYWNVKNGDAND